MGYTHYWRRLPEVGEEAFALVVRDVRRLLPVLAGPSGEGEPVLTRDELSFNGVRACGHVQRAVGVAWPAAGAAGVCLAAGLGSDGVAADLGSWWFAGRELRARSCGGDCSHESFCFPRVRRSLYAGERLEDGRFFDFCKTAFKPYDVAVQVALVVAAHYLGDAIVVRSDGSLEKWEDAIVLCERVLGFGRGFVLG